jgi:exopolysaccharide biosynthesis protein
MLYRYMLYRYSTTCTSLAHAVVVVALLAAWGCAPTQPVSLTHKALTSTWVSVDSLNAGLPHGVAVFAYQQSTPPLRAWYVSVTTDLAAIQPRIVTPADTTTNRASTLDIAADNNACIAVNGGYFTMNETPARHVGLLWLADTLHTPATSLTGRPGATRPARGAIGFTAAGLGDVTWASEDGQTLVQFDNEHTGPWHVTSALGAGPVILRSGEISVSATEEGFANTSIPATHPRTAAGVTRDGRLILMVVDGRQDASRGADVVELADLMRSAGAVDALNLDGGGSSTLIVNGRLINRPTGGTFQRPVMSAIVVTCE